MSKKFNYSPWYCYPTTTCPLLKKIQAIVAGEKQEHQQDEEENTLPGFKMSSKSCLAWAVFRKKEQKARAREEYMVLRNNLLGTENGIMWKRLLQ